jgi:spore coat polysaccharide biosynthesis predicted glycosyltransferase SpsG
MKALFITDGGLALGMGHVQQSISFASELGGEVAFSTKSDERVAAIIRDAGFDVTRFDDDTEIREHVARTRPDVVIFDKLDVSVELARSIRHDLQRKLVIFTNITDANRHAHMAIVADLGSRLKNVRFTDAETGTTYYHGPKYWVLRREFYEFHRLGKPRPQSIDCALLLFGGSDPSNLTSLAVEHLLRREHPSRLDVVIGAHYGHREALDRALARDTMKRVTVHQNIRNVAELMYGADVVLASPGLSAFEALCVGTPVLLVPHDSLQRSAYAGLVAMVDRDDMAKIGDALDKMELTFPQSPDIVEMDIGGGVAELVNDIKGLTQR